MPLHCAGDRYRRTWIEGLGRIEKIPHIVELGCKYRQSRRLCFQQRQSERFQQRRVDERTRVAIKAAYAPQRPRIHVRDLCPAAARLLDSLAERAVRSFGQRQGEARANVFLREKLPRVDQRRVVLVRLGR